MREIEKPLIAMTLEELQDDFIRKTVPRHIGTVMGIDLYELELVPENCVWINPRDARDGVIALRLDPWCRMVSVVRDQRKAPKDHGPSEQETRK